jgi:creatinine amidohydrolase
MSDADRSTWRGPRPGLSCALDELSWKEIQEHLRTDARLLFPVSALEQFGPHLPLGTGALIVERLVADVSEETGVLRAPPLSFGVNLPADPPWPGTASLRRKTFHRTVNELLAAWEDGGVRHFIPVTFQLYEPHVDALLMAFTTRAQTTVVDLGAVDVGDLLESPRALDHAGELSTSLMLHLAPERVRTEAMVDVPVPRGKYRRYLRGRAATPPRDGSGVLGSPTLASAAKGAALWDRFREALLSAVESQEG